MVVLGALRELGLNTKDTDVARPNARSEGADRLCTGRPLVAAVDPVGKQLGQARNPCAQRKRLYRILARSPMTSHYLRATYKP